MDDDAEPFERLFALYADRLHRHTFHYVRSWETAQDLVQDLFLRLWNRRGELASVADIEGYLYTAARNRALTHLRQSKLEERWQGDAAGEVRPATSSGAGGRPRRR